MDNLRRLADQLKHKVNDYADNPNSPETAVIRNSVQKLLDAVEARKDPDNLFEIAKEVERVIMDSRQTKVMDDNHWDDLRDRIQDFKQQARQLS